MPLAVAVLLALALLSAPATAAAASPARSELSPAAGPAGTQVTITVTRFARRSEYSVRLGSQVVATGRTSATGRLRASFTVPQRSAGAMRLSVRSGRRRVIHSFRISDVPGATDAREAADETGARLRLASVIVYTGGKLRIAGDGFPARRRIDVQSAGTRLGRPRADRRGSFRLEVTVPDIGEGGHALTVRTRGAGLGLTFKVAPDPVVVAAGDIACDPASDNFHGGAGEAGACRQMATSDVALQAKPAAVLPLGDLQYENGSLDRFQASYHPSWGRLFDITRPAVGNHEYLTPGAAGYFDYFGARAGEPSKGYYSFDLGAWHLVALNSNCGKAGGCDAGSPQERWLRADLAANPARCTLAYWHHPRFSSGVHGNDPDVQPLVQALYDAGADLMLAGHDHLYERFAPLAPDGRADPRGLRSFVVGTGGRNHTRVKAVQPGSEVRDDRTFGVLELVLGRRGYTWRFDAALRAAFTDMGQDACH